MTILSLYKSGQSDLEYGTHLKPRGKQAEQMAVDSNTTHKNSNKMTSTPNIMSITKQINDAAVTPISLSNAPPPDGSFSVLRGLIQSYTPGGESVEALTFVVDCLDTQDIMNLASVSLMGGRAVVEALVCGNVLLDFLEGAIRDYRQLADEIKRKDVVIKQLQEHLHIKSTDVANHKREEDDEYIKAKMKAKDDKIRELEKQIANQAEFMAQIMDMDMK